MPDELCRLEHKFSEYDLMPQSEIEVLAEKLLYMNWLRPETVPWKLHAALLTRNHLRFQTSMLEVGIGNGYASFQNLGGEFSPEFDWYHNVETEGFWNEADIYDQVKLSNIAAYVTAYPEYRFNTVMDHKPNLLDQARQLKIAENYVLADANGSIEFSDIDLVYSNMLYWLNDPITTIRKIGDKLKPGGSLITTFPNPRFVEYCRSYQRDTPMWTLLNRGRADSLMWTLDLEEFEKSLADQTDFVIEESHLYLSRLTLGNWDIGLRPVSPYLIRMANGLDPATRFSVKQDWCEGTQPLIAELVAQELELGPLEGGFNFCLLRKS